MESPKASIILLKSLFFLIVLKISQIFTNRPCTMLRQFSLSVYVDQIVKNIILIIEIYVLMNESTVDFFSINVLMKEVSQNLNCYIFRLSVLQ